MSDDMVEGYRDGLAATDVEPPLSIHNRGAAYLHGWLNGRDDRLKKPRSTAAALLLDALEAELKDRMPAPIPPISPKGG